MQEDADLQHPHDVVVRGDDQVQGQTAAQQLHVIFPTAEGAGNSHDVAGHALQNLKVKAKGQRWSFCGQYQHCCQLNWCLCRRNSRLMISIHALCLTHAHAWCDSCLHV